MRVFYRLAPLVLAALLPFSAGAKPVAVTLYPSGALVTEEFQAQADGNFTLDLPAALDEGSLRFSTAKGAPQGVRLQKVEGKESGPLAALRERKQNLEARLDAEKARGEALAALLTRLTTTPPKAAKTTPKPSAKPGKEPAAPEIGPEDKLRRNLEELSRQRLASERAARGMEAALTELDARLKSLGGEKDTLRCTLENVPAGAVQASYLISFAGWTPRYTVEAQPEEGLVRLALAARMRQNSGRDWERLELTLATANAPSGVTPPTLSPMPRPLLFKSASPSSLGVSTRAVSRGITADAEAPEAMAAVEFSAREEAGGRAWRPGALSLPDDSPFLLPLEEHTLKANFVRLARPSAGSSVWIQARLENPGDSPFLPAGEASFLLDGLLVGRDEFSLSPADSALSFGRDPLVTVERTALPARAEESDSGEGKGSSAAEKTMDKTAEKAPVERSNMRWLITLKNGHSAPVRVRVEEPAPLHRDADVRVFERSEPSPALDETKNAYVWELELPGHGSATIREDLLILTPRH